MIRLALFGADPDSPNMGVSALFMSTVEGLSAVIPDLEFVVFDNGLGQREGQLILSTGRQIRLIRQGARVGRRYYRPENLLTMLLISKIGRFGAWLNAGIRLIDSCDAVLDISGGDSFSDLYGMKRFNAICWPKKIALARRIPLILLPQTYGPYHDPDVFARASEVVRGAELAWARDENSFLILKQLLADDVDSHRHFSGVDMAFGLNPKDASAKLDAEILDWLRAKDSESPVIGINVSGLIYNDPQSAKQAYHFKANYRLALLDLVQRLLNDTQVKLLLVPHVMDTEGHYESDVSASRDLYQSLNIDDQKRVLITPVALDQSEVKWVISTLDWFCGTRMHSTIAGLSSRVPTATISYSDKAKGVFETCGQSAQVYDPRELAEEELVEQLLASFASRAQIKASLERSIPPLVLAASSQLDVIAKWLSNEAT